MVKFINAKIWFAKVDVALIKVLKIKFSQLIIAKITTIVNNAGIKKI